MCLRLILTCQLVLLLLNPAIQFVSSENTTQNNSTTKVTNFQIKTTNAANLPSVQVQEIVAPNSGERSGRRKITPTQNLTVDLNTTANVTGKSPASQENLKMLAEGVLMPMPAMTVANKTETVKSAKSENANDTSSAPSKNVTAAVIRSETGAAHEIQTQITNTNHTPPQLPAAVNVTVNGTTDANNVTALNYKNATAIIKITPSTIAKTANVSISSNTSNSTTSTSTTSTTATTTTTTTATTSTTTTTTTTPRPKKPRITYGVEDFPDLDANILRDEQTRPSAPPLPEMAPVHEAPNAEPSQEMSASFPYNSSHDFFVPFLTIMFTVPLAIGVVITAYRRFRDFWSTRHYRRMDFLVDGMYND